VLASPIVTRGGGLRLTWAALAVLVALATPGIARAQALRTWGGQVTPAEIKPGEEPTPSAEPPPPPPATMGTALEGSASLPPAPPPPEPLDEGPSAIVRAPGHVSLRYLLEGVEVRGNTTTLSRVVLRYIPFHAGDTIDVDDKELELTRFRLLGTGFFRDVQLSLRRGSKRGNAILVVSVVERNTIILNDVWLGLATDANSQGQVRPITAYGGLDVAETNLAGTGITIGGAVAFAENQYGLRARFADPQFLSSEWTVEAQLLYNDAKDFFGNSDVLVQQANNMPAVPEDYAVISYQRFGGMVGGGHDLGISTRLFLDYRLEGIDAVLPLAASDHRGTQIEPIDFQIINGASVLSVLRATLVHDTRDEPFSPTKGSLLSLVGDASLTPLGSSYPYFKIQAHASHWFRLPWGHVLELDAFAGSVFGTAPMFEKFFVGDLSDLLPDRVLDLAFDRRVAPDFLSTDIALIRYGQYAAKLNAEYRMPLYRGTRSIYGVDVFGSFGVYGLANPQDITNPAQGYTGLATIPIDLTFNLGVRVETSAGGIVFGLSNFLPFVEKRGSQ
jgi:outer membrane protein insertion porin family